MNISRYDYFAGQALAGLLANSEAGGEPTLHALFGTARQRHSDGLAEIAHMLAASMCAIDADETAGRRLRDLVAALDGAHISSWQSTAAWQDQLDLAREHLAKLDGRVV